MEGNNLIKKGVIVAVIFLFIGLAFAPSINANVSKASLGNELVEITTEIWGIDGVKSHRVELTTKEVNELDKLFENIRARLNEPKSGEESEEIFKEAVVELDKMGLLGGLDVKQAQNLVVGEYQNPRAMKIKEVFIDRSKSKGDDENYNCQVVGKTNYTGFFSATPRFRENFILPLYSLYFSISRLPLIYFLLISWLVAREIFDMEMWEELILITSIFVDFRTNIIYNLFPFDFNKCGTLGSYHLESGEIVEPTPSEGWVWTNGSRGVVEWEGNLYGITGDNWIAREGSKVKYCEAIEHFTGIRFFKNDWVSDFFSYYFNDELRVGNAYYLGIAKCVKIGYEPYLRIR